MLIEDELDELEKNFRDDVPEAMKHDEGAVANNRFFDERGLKNNLC